MMNRAGGAPLAVGWATVELDRAAIELAPLVAPGERFEPAPDCEILGARCRVARAGDAASAGAPLVILLEPTTEGRLAATLARHGEGWWVTWEPDEDRHDDAEPRSVALPGPIGPERLRDGGSVFGPHRLLVRAATIGS
jgi:hypothetical protein